MKMHLNLSTRDLDASVAFYATLLDRKPAKKFDDYALFISENPGLELALDVDRSGTVAHGEHFGIVVESVEAVETQATRLRDAGFAVDMEHEETCCYAVQTKAWVSDPDGRRWETYVVHAESDELECCP
jgi:catechol 2,3-dioxygenase-like lactoylglutathione lyase family enzyme